MKRRRAPPLLSWLALAAVTQRACVAQHEETILAVADRHACAIEHGLESDTAGPLVCWGSNDFDELDAPEVRARARGAAPGRAARAPRG